MKVNALYLAILSIFLNFNLYAHEGGHNHAANIWMINDVPTVAEFVKYDNGKVYLRTTDHQLKAYELSFFTKEQQELVLESDQVVAMINGSKISSNRISVILATDSFWYFLGGLIISISLYFFLSKKKKFHLSYGVMGAFIVAFTACSNNDIIDPTPTTTIDIPANDVNFLASLFGKFSGVSTDSDDEWFYISSNGLPTHNMMVGITNWQQQVPIDQNYSGNNSWAIPIQPELSNNPLSTQTNLLKGAIAIAVNGIPIFNPLNNRGEDANEIGELDQWGGHCGRADDYHYHLPPTHLQSIVGIENPIAYAVDGFPVYGETTDELDEYLGKFNADSSYQYHTVSMYPYFIAGMRGKVTLDPNSNAPENQVIPQAMTRELRPATSPLRGAEIIDFLKLGESTYTLTYTLNGESYQINYSWDANGLYTYEFIDPDGSSSIETYQR